MSGTWAAVVASLLVLLAEWLAASSAAGGKLRPGDFDPSFSGNGVVLTQPNGRTGMADALAIGRKHRIVAAGNNDIGFALVRYQPKGKLDPSFSHDGMLSTAFGNDDAGADSVAISGGGPILAAGTVCTETDECRFALARYKADGHPDRSFGRGGQVTLDFGGTSASARSVAIDPRGGFLVAGSTCQGRHCDFALARLNRNGELDRGFGNGGRVVTRFDSQDPTAHAAIASMAIDSGDRIIVGGSLPPLRAHRRPVRGGRPGLDRVPQAARCRHRGRTAGRRRVREASLRRGPVHWVGPDHRGMQWDNWQVTRASRDSHGGYAQS